MTTVLLHPFPFDHRVWSAVSAHLPGDVVSVDYVGCGNRALPDDVPSMASIAQDVWHQLDLAGKSENPTLVGISLGGYVAMEMIRQRPVAALALVDTKVTPDTPEGRINRERLAVSMEQRGGLELYAEQALPTMLGEFTLAQRPHVVSQVRDWITASDPRAVAWLARAMAQRPDSTTDLKDFAGPVLLVRGDQDVISTPQDFAHMQQASPHATCVTINNCGHLPPVEDAQTTAVELSNWLAYL